MTYQRERDEFISRATREGLSLDVCRKLLRYATTLQRLAEAQCNGDWPYNGDRDRPARCNCLPDTDPQNKCNAERARERWDARYTICPKCEASGVAKTAMRLSHENGIPKSQYPVERVKVCPDCRTQELVRELLCTRTHLGPEDTHDTLCSDFTPIFQGDPRGAVLLLATPSFPWSKDGSKGRGLVVPARGTR